ncbi:IclR family transcriptional regulator [Haladaptatus sp. AB618]|uniref:IclR family transcriptional regulator n=1 Tax=Haladaptatus sp. AB618 TaxID=2934173 RepID=UPI00209C0BCD|nr:IclR family transcriptional regulator [Haladaptatus sp. AB618]MCO8256836.1 IclR family transcriptional regulator [Haladaptatus sp. AB618]
MSEGSRTLKSGTTLFRVLESLRESDGASVTELADRLGLAKSTVHVHLSTLKAARYVVQEGDVYYVGLRFLGLSEYARTRKEAYRLAESLVVELAEETDERAQFIAEEHGKGIYLYRETGERAVRTDSGVGKEILLHSTAAGKAILALFPDERIHEIVDRWGLPARTSATITDKKRLWTEIETIRERGYAFNRGENIESLNAVGVPVKRSDGTVIGAFSVSAPAHRLEGERLETQVPELLLGVTNELELKIAYS